jgi:heptaprenyl diphosphate synthase
MKLLDIYQILKHDLGIIEQELEQSVKSDHAVLGEASAHLLKAGGKRIRPIFVLLSGQFGSYDLEKLKLIAVPLELIHMASLVHDDVIDDAETRRGQLTVKSKWDNRIAMYTGDYIHAKALTIATQLDNPQIHRVLSKAIVQMCLGEIEQIRDFFNTEQTVRNYLLRIRRKTALLIAISCQLGAMTAGASAETVRCLYRFGYNVGMAFQIRDDLLDISGTEQQTGKPSGSDMRQGNLTLPVLLALREANIRDELMREIIRIRNTEGQADVSKAVSLIRSSNGLRCSEQLADRYIEKSLAALEPLPPIQAKKNLMEVARFIANRMY